MFTVSFLKAALERAVKSFAGVLVAFLPASGTSAVPDIDWGDRLTLAGYAALASLLMSVLSAPFGGTGPSLANEAIVPPAVDPGQDDGYGALELLVAVLVVVILVLLILRLA